MGKEAIVLIMAKIRVAFPTSSSLAWGMMDDGQSRSRLDLLSERAHVMQSQPIRSINAKYGYLTGNRVTQTIGILILKRYGIDACIKYCSYRYILSIPYGYMKLLGILWQLLLVTPQNEGIEVMQSFQCKNHQVLVTCALGLNGARFLVGTPTIAEKIDLIEIH
ncbi:uncharacterized protein BDR25DRAFT_395514 [Lindgomyces ingoldianus]|uniref:Uncharacterized protein n=1 Tax=Lindgomyces ingoldianus TaxID=673940 RepID=A0ACB6QKF9_9PLEO|nr:uncharacterized protein BDR25DRAFT_395514 [Lindgomyces ingoldianus]KAF2467005.1 hypothetical protein BDR25DRAFT_395514 [Lindgomyces ingoldianus]